MEGAKDNTTMKKTYIEPKTTVVALGVEKIVCTSGDFTETQITDTNNFGAREVIQEEISAPDVWEEW